jgi:hypothetical protein
MIHQDGGSLKVRLVNEDPRGGLWRKGETDFKRVVVAENLRRNALGLQKKSQVVSFQAKTGRIKLSHWWSESL